MARWYGTYSKSSVSDRIPPMTLERMQQLWPMAKALHEARRDLAWGGAAGERREPWPEFSAAYSHHPIAYVDLALAQADAITIQPDAAN